MTFFVHTYIRMFFLLAPFFGVSMFLKMSDGMQPHARRRAALRCSGAILFMILLFFYFGQSIFPLLGITLPAFQVGAGSTLFISSVMLVLGTGKRGSQPQDEHDDDFAVVPLAIPIVVGPGTIGTLLVWGTEVVDPQLRTIACAAIMCSGITVAIFLLLAEKIQRLLGQKVLAIMTKVTALILVSLAAQIILSGVKTFLAT